MKKCATENLFARGKFQGKDLDNIPIVNPGGFLGKTWLVSINSEASPVFLIVEAFSIQHAFDELANSDEWSHYVLVEDKSLVEIHGWDEKRTPFSCRYYGKGLPVDGVFPCDFNYERFRLLILSKG